jgi:hypothetical protein
MAPRSFKERGAPALHAAEAETLAEQGVDGGGGFSPAAAFTAEVTTAVVGGVLHRQGEDEKGQAKLRPKEKKKDHARSSSSPEKGSRRREISTLRRGGGSLDARPGQTARGVFRGALGGLQLTQNTAQG